MGVFYDGGYSAAPRVVFAAAGVGAGVVAVAVDRRPLREPLFLVLVAVAALSALSALWTLGAEERTLRAGFVALGLCGVLLGAAVAGRDRRGRGALAVGLGLIAVVAGVIGVVAVVIEAEPYALRIGGSWRAAGPFEYPPALALLMASALPLFLALSQLAPRIGGLLGTVAGGTLVAAVLVLAESRIGLALGLGIAALVLLRDRRAIAAALLIALVVGAFAFGNGDGPDSNFIHGREKTWEAAVETFADRPLLGTGADAFLAGSARHQDGAAIRFAHNLPLEFAAELGIAGLLLALALYTAAFRLVWRARRDPAVWLFGPAALAFLVSNLLDWPWHFAGAGAVWCVALGSLAAPHSDQGDK